ncbi:hypothetical protein MKW92_044789 [Papaver armeniacum]|nr:hypothetical protein MKW92_044789 [Papaver armeniacum]
MLNIFKKTRINQSDDWIRSTLEKRVHATGNEKLNNYWEAELSQANVQESAPWTRYELSQLSAGELAHMHIAYICENHIEM